MRRFATLATAVLAVSCAPARRPLGDGGALSHPARAACCARDAQPQRTPAAPARRGAASEPGPAHSSSAAAPEPERSDDGVSGGLVELAVPGHAAAVVALPEAGRHPVLVATHGAGGTPEAHCAYWHELVGGSAFVLCPRGVTMDVYAPPEARGWFYPDHPALEREVRAALAALAARFPGRVDLDRAVYAGFSQGAVMGALALSRAPSPFTALVLVEGGAEEWAMHNARSFARGGGRRVLFACGRRTCADPARRSAAYLRGAGVESRVIDASGAGHTNEGAVREGLVEALPWLFAGDDRFAR